ncbi:permease [Novosphingobium sp.]|uniref:CBU_0592 family membrane protein n=1 Tax=Novosphingobium sp. TaxID=1874826 RepID=UPI002737560E|nr:permease [Novosphingobium sp.]MDP3906796.1 permease [Novosphingobium sp.]
MNETLANVIGLLGTVCIIFAYGYATAHRAPNPFVQHSVNLLGAAFLTVSLLVNFNLASLVLEFFWAAIAIWGLVRAWLERGRRRGAAA